MRKTLNFTFIRFLAESLLPQVGGLCARLVLPQSPHPQKSGRATLRRLSSQKAGLIFLLGFCITVFSCHYSNEYQMVNANNKFSLAVPGWMKEVDNLKPGADFQYANRYRNFYAIGTADDKSKPGEPLPLVMNDNLNVLRKSLKNPVVTDSVPVNVGGLNGVRVEIYGKMNNENIYFSEMLLEGKTNLYHISVWTRSEDRKLRFKDDINRILSSFKEI